MRVLLIGADFEENLGMGYLAAAIEQAGHQAHILPYQRREQLDRVASIAIGLKTDVIGLSIQFQHRVVDFLALAQLLRARAFGGHICCGGQVASLATEDVLRLAPAIDSAVRFEGEQTFVDLLSALEHGNDLFDVPGLALRDGDQVRITAMRPLCSDLDELAWPLRYRPHSRHMGLPFIPVLGSRGCWGSCTFCSIASFNAQAKGSGRGNRYRQRGVTDLADEMAALSQQVGGGPALFCFHDDTLLLPKPEATLKRLRGLRLALDDREVGRLGLIGKCRPDCLTVELARELRELGMLRLYVGVENASAAGLKNLNRRASQKDIQGALDACAAADIFACYNLLIYEPDTTLSDVADNLAFMRHNAHHPVNFCRAEPYMQTTLHQNLVAAGTLQGDLRSWNYRITDDRAELLFRITAAAFRQRNFADKGVANQSMALGYSAKILKHFVGGPETHRLDGEAVDLTEKVVLNTCAHLQEALDFAATIDVDDRDRIERFTATLGLRVATADAGLAVEINELLQRMEALGRASDLGRRAVEMDPKRESASSARRALVGAALSVGLVASAASIGGGTTVDPVPPDGSQIYDSDPLPADAGDPDAPRSDRGALDYGLVDPAPLDAGEPDITLVDPAPMDAGYGADVPIVVDPAPMDAGYGADVPIVVDPAPMDAGSSADVPIVVDPAPMDAGYMSADVPMVDPAPIDAGAVGLAPMGPRQVEQALASVSGIYARRSADLPMDQPPAPKLWLRRSGDQVHVELRGNGGPLSCLYEVSSGEIEGEGQRVVWRNARDGAQLRVAVRAAGGVAVLHRVL